MFFRRLNIHIAVNLFFVMGTAMLLLNAVVIHVEKNLLLKSEFSKAAMLTAGIENLLISACASGSQISPSALTPYLEGMLAASPFSVLSVTDSQGQDFWFSAKPDTPHRELRQVTEEMMHTGRRVIRFTGITWGVFWKQKRDMLIAFPVLYGQERIAGIALVMPLHSVYQPLRHSQIILVTYILVNLFVLTVAGSWRLAGILRRPMNRLAKRAEEFKEEDDILFLSEAEGSEFSQVSKALNRMLCRISSGKEELKHTIRSLEKANRDLKKAQNDIIRAEKLASVGRLAAGIAHEIGNPIAIVMGYLELLRQPDIAGEEKTDFIRRTESEVSRINAIIRQLLDFSRPSDGSRSEAPVHGILEDTVAMFRFQPRMSDIGISLSLCANPDTVKADPSQLRQIFLNLMMNAADAVASSGKEDPGRIIVSTCTEMIEKQTGQPISMLRIEFQDNGAGIAEKDMENIFEPFYTTKEPGKGTGLGLSVCYMIIEALGGTIRAESLEGKGTSMIIHLPLYAENRNAENGVPKESHDCGKDTKTTAHY
ncbi:MAG: ATP-binding protein [Desulfobacterales bacterium]